MARLTEQDLEDLQEEKAKQLKEFLDAQPPEKNGEDLLRLWEGVYDEAMQHTVVETRTGPSDDGANRVFPYEKLQAVVKDGGNWKWPRMWQRFDELERRGEAYRDGEALNFRQPSKNPGIQSMKVLIVGGGPIGLRMAIELMMGGHKVTLFEKRREKLEVDGSMQSLGFTNRINRPHMWPFVRNDLAKLNGKDLMSRVCAYPVFTEPETSSIGIDELQCLLLKNALLLGVDFRLGAEYKNAKVTLEGDTLRPSWDVEFTYDEQAAKKFNGQAGVNHEAFDVLVGCDGPRSTVRETQSKYFGDVDKRKFMDCVGIVANVQKLSRRRLKELGFEFGQEPSDMNRSKLCFKEFFNRIKQECDADIEQLIYYKASHHNYAIMVPKRPDLIKHGLSGKVYTFHQGREGRGHQEEEKQKLKSYCSKVLQAARIPVDDQASNGGFVGVPNDCMAFDFAECWNTKRSLFFNLPPGNYSVEEDGEWEGRRIVPLVALAGDALMEPFWPMGLGLKRGWQAVMDTCYVIDNLYNAQHFCEKLGKTPDSWTWDEHYESLLAQAGTNFEYCNRLQVGKDLAAGEWDEKGLVMTQLRKRLKDCEKPPLEIQIDPWTRYEPLAFTESQKHKELAKDGRWLHPAVEKAIALHEQCQATYKGKELISYDGRVVGGNTQHGRKSSAAPAKKAIGVGAGLVSRKAAAAVASSAAAAPAAATTDPASDAAKQGTASAAGSMAAAMMGGAAALKPLTKVSVPEAAPVAAPAAAAAGEASPATRRKSWHERRHDRRHGEPGGMASLIKTAAATVRADDSEISVDEANDNVEKSRRLLAVREKIARSAKELQDARAEEKALLAEK